MRTSTSAFILLSSTLTTALPYGDEKRSEPKGINWAPCDLDFPDDLKEAIKTPIDCAILEVPLDYSDPEAQEMLPLTLVKVNATKEPFKGSAIFNPGGPGGSGIEEVATKGSLYRDVLGGQFNIIGFDVRGVGSTIPFACDLTKKTNTTGEPVKSIAWHPHNNDTHRLPQLDPWELLQSKAWDDGTWFSNACVKGNEGIGRFLGTAFVARDMLQIVDALNEDGKLRFWGRSYSTDLGQTFAAMFPDRVDRMLLDSVHKTTEYNIGSWITATRNTQDSLLNVLSECVTAGPELCPIANFTGPDTTAVDLMEAIGEAFQGLIDEPVVLDETYPLYLPWWRPGGLPLLPELKYRILQNIYRPDQLTDLIPILQAVLAKDWEMPSAPAASNETTPLPEPWSKGANAFHGIACGDATFRATSVDDMYTTIQAQAEEGSFADAFSPQDWICAQWKFEAAERYNGTFRNINTSHPIMFANGAHDPITPLSAAWDAASGFTGSSLLVHNGHGHGVMSHPSSCTIQAIGKYFMEGTLPAPGTVCEPDMSMFDYAIELAGQAEGNGDAQAKRSLNEVSFKNMIKFPKRQTKPSMAEFGA